ncbi:1,5-anhydro-D-fructose reductase-like isoform X2 [Haliotis rufescens]|uniref:1,5-anhydro-D-fructose reductase-like isoform X2 n=1 Tax=Haliotis rufescens TaxID=6454 RepID=UPI00201F3389|nr:1,5-anhydro-D-fructose reductase-like isoform X2 [Haliotis rufescens]
MSGSLPFVSFYNGGCMPSMGLGTWKSEKGKVTEAVKVAIESGYRHIDCAWCYGNEAEVGLGIKAKVDDGTVTREDLFITTKLWCTHHEPGRVEAAVRDSLDKLDVSYVDLYLMHAPFAFKESNEICPRDAAGNLLMSDVDYVDTWKAMESLVDKGLVKYIGVSNFNLEQMERLLKTDGLKLKPVTNQIEVSPYLTNDKLVSFCKENGVTVTAYAPLGSADNPALQSMKDRPLIATEPTLQELGRKYGKTAAQVALRWGVQRNLSVIPKSVTPSRIKENIQILDFELTEEDMKVVSDLNRDFRACSFLFVPKHKYHPFNTA